MPPMPFRPTARALARAAARGGPAAAEAQALADARARAFRELVHGRASARGFAPDAPAVPDGVWRDVLRLTRTAPSGFNLQPTHVILLRCPELKATLARHAMLGFGNQQRTRDAAAVAVFCADLEPGKRVDRVYELETAAGARGDGYLAVMRVASAFLTGDGTTADSSTSLATFFKRTFAGALSPVQPMPTMERAESWSYKNAGIAAQLYTLAASAHGLSTCMMEGFDARRAREILRVPDRYGLPLMVATGYAPGAPPAVHAEEDDAAPPGGRWKAPRLEARELFFGDTFGGALDLFDGVAPAGEERAA